MRAVCGVLRTCGRGPSVSLALGGCRSGLPWGCPAALPDGATEILTGPRPLCLRTLVRLGCDEAGTWAIDILQYTATLCQALGSEDPSVYHHNVVGSGQWAVGSGGVFGKT